VITDTGTSKPASDPDTIVAGWWSPSMITTVSSSP
jgi:hypothetical protein